jgi:hypothetical protein
VRTGAALVLVRLRQRRHRRQRGQREVRPTAAAELAVRLLRASPSELLASSPSELSASSSELSSVTQRAHLLRLGAAARGERRAGRCALALAHAHYTRVRRLVRPHRHLMRPHRPSHVVSVEARYRSNREPEATTFQRLVGGLIDVPHRSNAEGEGEIQDLAFSEMQNSLRIFR